MIKSKYIEDFVLIQLNPNKKFVSCTRNAFHLKLHAGVPYGTGLKQLTLFVISHVTFVSINNGDKKYILNVI